MEDIKKQFFKITNKDENHHGFQYVDGLNVLKQPFNDNIHAHCVAGGLYFTDADNILDFLSYGIYLRDITLPISDPDFKIVKDEMKWRANKIILGKRYDLQDPETFEYLAKSGADIKNNSTAISNWALSLEYLLILKYLKEKGLLSLSKYDSSHYMEEAITNNHIEIIKFYLDIGIDYEDNIIKLHRNNNTELLKIFIEKIKEQPKKILKTLENLCKYGYLPVIKLLLGEEDNPLCKFIDDYSQAAVIACRNNNLEIIKYFVSIGMDQKTINNLFEIACKNNNSPEMLKYLISVGADICTNNNECLVHALKENNFEIVKFLAENGASSKNIDTKSLKRFINNYPIEKVKYLFGLDIGKEIISDVFETACWDNASMDLIKYFISVGVDIAVNNNAPLYYAFKANNFELVKLLVENGASFKNFDINIIKALILNYSIEHCKYLFPLMPINSEIINDLFRYYCRTDNLEMVKYLISLGADIHIDNNELLYYAFRENNFELVKIMVENSTQLGDTNFIPVKSSIVNYSLDQIKILFGWGIVRDEICTDIWKNACQKGNMEILKYLIESGIDHKCMESYALRWASRKGHLEMVQYLVSLGDNVGAMNNFAVKWAAKRGYLDVVKFLVESGADFRANNNCAVKWADEHNQDHVVKYLVGLGAQI